MSTMTDTTMTQTDSNSVLRKAMLGKQKIIDDLGAELQRASVVVAAEYNGLSANEMSDLRRQARDQDVYIRVVKNTLVRRSLQGTPFSDLAEDLTGPLILLFSRDDIGSAPRLCRAYNKEHSVFTVRHLATRSEKLTPDSLERLADLPTHEEAVARLLGVMLAPVGQLARLLKLLPANLTIVLRMRADQQKAEK